MTGVFGRAPDQAFECIEPVHFRELGIQNDTIRHERGYRLDGCDEFPSRGECVYVDTS